MANIKNGDRVKVEYTGKLADGTVFDSSQGRAPLEFEVGTGQVIPGFEKAVNGMKKNDNKTFTIPVDQAYGPVKAELEIEVPRNKLPPQPEPQVGFTLIMRSPNGEQIPARITKISKDKVTLDLNHPLAGKDLTFEINIVGVNDKPTDEDGCGGCCSDCGGGCGH